MRPKQARICAQIPSRGEAVTVQDHRGRVLERIGKHTNARRDVASCAVVRHHPANDALFDQRCGNIADPDEANLPAVAAVGVDLDYGDRRAAGCSQRPRTAAWCASGP